MARASSPTSRNQLLWLKDARTAADILEHAIPRTQHPAARSLLHLRQARALALLNEDGRCRRVLTAAEKALDTVSYDPAPAWCSWMSHADLASDGGRCLADLGQRSQAHRLMDEGIALLPATRSKTKSVFLTYQAETYLRDGEPDIAAETAIRSLDLASRIDAPRCVTMVRDLEPAFAPYAHTAGVDELLERPRAVGRGSVTGRWYLISSGRPGAKERGWKLPLVTTRVEQGSCRTRRRASGFGLRAPGGMLVVNRAASRQ
ncbi:hypothetical protein [Streptomyces sp. NRRL S-31]|uniref:hypothetical protein n=1 Tax=Streptomyces sp. NRRL S-31 TaxID=1463898 RepID=UPI00069A8780|nr:hypothetical protein [Streptomyces sp. NRRL S-31]